MELIQVHPTAFIDPKRPNDEQKVLCAEILRGVGGILVNHKGKRFCNELGRRDYVVSKMKEQETPNLHFTILLPSGVEKLAAKHIQIYSNKGLLKKFETISEVAEHLKLKKETL